MLRKTTSVFSTPLFIQAASKTGTKLLQNNPSSGISSVGTGTQFFPKKAREQFIVTQPHQQLSNDFLKFSSTQGDMSSPMIWHPGMEKVKMYSKGDFEDIDIESTPKYDMSRPTSSEGKAPKRTVVDADLLMTSRQLEALFASSASGSGSDAGGIDDGFSSSSKGGSEPPSGKNKLLGLAGFGGLLLLSAYAVRDDKSKSMDECPIPADQITETNLQSLGQNKDKLTQVAAQISEMSSTKQQEAYISGFTQTLTEGHTYAVAAKATILTPEEIQKVRDMGPEVMREMVAGFPNGAQTLERVQESQPEDFISGRVQLGRGSIVDVTNHVSFETDRYIINSITPITSETHPLDGTATWIHVVDKETGKASFAVLGAGKHPIPPSDLANNYLVGPGGIWDHVGQTFHSKIQGTPPPCGTFLTMTDRLSPIAAWGRSTML